MKDEPTREELVSDIGKLQTKILDDGLKIKGLKAENERLEKELDSAVNTELRRQSEDMMGELAEKIAENRRLRKRYCGQRDTRCSRRLPLLPDDPPPPPALVRSEVADDDYTPENPPDGMPALDEYISEYEALDNLGVQSWSRAINEIRSRLLGCDILDKRINEIFKRLGDLEAVHPHSLRKVEENE